MMQGFISRRCTLCLPLLAATFGCDGTHAPASGPTETSRSQVSANTPNQGAAQVEVVINHAPLVTSMLSSAGRVASEMPVTLLAVASDSDGDATSFVWKSSCSGSFDRTDLAQVTFTARALDAAASCTFEVDVSDGHGGVGKGSLVLSAALPEFNIAPQMGIVYQSTDNADAGEVVILHATATDPEGEALTWDWKSDGGAFSNQADEAGASDVQWTAPATPGITYTITATATDPEAVSASFVFTVKVAS